MGTNLDLTLQMSVNSTSSRFFQPNDIAGYLFATNPADPTCAVDDGTAQCGRLNDLYNKSVYLGGPGSSGNPQIVYTAGILGDIRCLRFSTGNGEYMSVGLGSGLSALAAMWNQSNFQTGDGYAMFAYRPDAVSGSNGVVQWSNATTSTKVQYRVGGSADPGISYIQTGQATAFVTGTGATLEWAIAEIIKSANTITIRVNGTQIAQATVGQTTSMANTDFGISWGPGPQAIFNGAIGAQAYYSAIPTATEQARLLRWMQITLIAPQSSAAAFADSIGVNCHFGQTPTPYVTDYAVTAAGIADLGVKWCREDLAIQQANGTPIDPTAEYGRMNGITGVKWSVVCFDHNNTFLYTPPSSMPGIFTALGGNLKYFEGSNEPNLGGNSTKATESYQHQADMQTVWNANPQFAAGGTQLIGPSYISSTWSGALNAAGTCQIGNFHPYPGNDWPDIAQLAGTSMTYMQAQGRFIYPYPLNYVATETGYNTCLTQGSFPPLDANTRGRYVMRMAAYYWSVGVPAICFYEFRSSVNPSTSPNDAEAFFGLMDYDGTKTQAFFAIKNGLALLRATDLPGAPAFPARIVTFPTGQGPNLCMLNLQRADGRNVLMIWLAINSYNSGSHVPLTPTTASVTVEFLNALGTPTKYVQADAGTLSSASLPLTAGQATFNVSDQMTYVVS